MATNIQTAMPPRPYKIGLALSGGGARGYAHIGVIRALEEFGIKPDIVAGVSAGSIIGSFFCAGVPTDEMEICFEGEHFKDFAEINIPRVSLFSTEGFHDFLHQILGNTTFDELEIPFRVIATDLDHGVSKIFSEGSVADAVWASSSIPVIFPPVVIDDIHYIDGGVLRNFPVQPIRNLCDFIIGVNVNPLVLNTVYKQNILGIAERAYMMMFRSNSAEDSKLCDLLIETEEIADYNIFDLKHIRQISDAGHEAAQRILINFEKNGKLPS